MGKTVIYAPEKFRSIFLSGSIEMGAAMAKTNCTIFSCYYCFAGLPHSCPVCQAIGGAKNG